MSMDAHVPNCPLCEAPALDYAPNIITVYQGVEYHAACLYAEMPELRPESVTTVAPSSEERKTWTH